MVVMVVMCNWESCRSFCTIDIQRSNLNGRMSWRPVMTSNLREMTKAYNRPLSTISSATDAQRHLHGALARTCKNDRNAKKFEKAAPDSGWPSHLESGINKLNNAQAMRWTRVNAFDFLTLRVRWGPLWEVLCLRPDLSLSPFTAVDLIRFESIRRQGYTGVSGFFWHDEIICIYNVNVYLLVVSMCSLHFSHMMMFLSIILSYHGRGRSLRDAFRISIVAVSTFYVTWDAFDIHNRM